MTQVKPKKALGQHFLTDTDIARRIADTLLPYKGLRVVEVGPGMGVLTRFLLEAGHDVTVIEIDRESVEYLKTRFPQLESEGRIIEGDFLTTDLNELFPGPEPICVIGNYPYNISSQIFFHILDYKDRVICCSGMLQKEVAERITAPEGNKTRGILSVLLQAWYNAEYLFTVSEHVFNPPPKVKSGVIRLVRNDVIDLGTDPRLFKQVVKTTFGQRRKMLRSSLRPLWGTATPPPTDHPLLSMRPEQLSVARFIELTNLVASTRRQQ